jgi:hypothetical protein
MVHPPFYFLTYLLYDNLWAQASQNRLQNGYFCGKVGNESTE